MVGALKQRNAFRIAMAHAIVGGGIVESVSTIEATLEALTAAVGQPESRQEVFVRDAVRRNAWFEPILDEPEFVALRERLKPAE